MGVLMLVVTIIAACVVAWQSVETHRSADSAKEALAVANRALQIAQAEEGHSRQLVAESFRARIDERTPVVTIHPGRVGVAADEEPKRLPIDGAVSLAVSVDVEIRNDSREAMTLRNQISPDHGGAGPWDITIANGDQKVIRLEIERPISEWAAVADWIFTGGDDRTDAQRFRDAHDGAERDIVVNFTYLAPLDSGAWDIYGFRLTGSPLVQSPDSHSEYVVDPSNLTLQFVAQPVVRHYYVSRTEGLELPSGTSASLPGLPAWLAHL